MMHKQNKKVDIVTAKGVIIEPLPNAMFRVKLENEHIVIVHVCGKIRRNRINIVKGDRVTVELSTHDLSRGRIVLRESTGFPPRKNK